MIRCEFAIKLVNNLKVSETINQTRSFYHGSEKSGRSRSENIVDAVQYR